MKLSSFAAGVAALSLWTVAACGQTESRVDEAQEGARFDFRISALNLVGVQGVVYGIAVETADGQAVWSRSDLDSTRFGDGVGAISYVGPCDATPSSNPHRIALTVHELRTGAGQVIPPSDYQNPAPPEAPIIVSATCLENADVPVTLNLTIMRRAEQGFFDIGVTFDAIFCSAKFDCKRNGQPFDFLFNPLTERRDTTVILGFSCTSGTNAAGEGTPTWLHLSNVLVTCEDEVGAPVTFLVDPSGPEGNNGGAGSLFFQTGIYRGQESLEPYDKCYWNMAFGVNVGLGQPVRSCRLQAAGTASSAPFGPSGATPSGTVYPVITWDIALTDETGGLACDVHPLNGTGTDMGVYTDYTDWSGTAFSHAWQCGHETEIVANALSCAGQTELGHEVSFLPQPSGLSVKFGNAIDPEYYALPEGYAFGANTQCCTNPCCGQ